MFIDFAHPGESEVRAVWRRLFESEGQVFEDDSGGESGLAMAMRAFRESGLVDEQGRPLPSAAPGSPIDMGPIEVHRRYAEDKLQQMIDYAEGSRCRKLSILAYFGENGEPDCGECDRCTEGAGSGAVFHESLFQLLKEFRDRTARKRRSDPDRVLPDRALEDLAMHRPQDMDELLQTWGIQQTRADWLGEDILEIIAVWERRNPDVGKRATRQVSSTRARSSERVGGDVEISDVAGDPLFGRLKEWRRERAERDSVPAYVVFWDRALAAIAQARPTTKAELSRVFGLGAAKLDKYGDEILEITSSE